MLVIPVNFLNLLVNFKIDTWSICCRQARWLALVGPVTQPQFKKMMNHRIQHKLTHQCIRQPLAVMWLNLLQTHHIHPVQIMVYRKLLMKWVQNYEQSGSFDIKQRKRKIQLYKQTNQSHELRVLLQDGICTITFNICMIIQRKCHVVQSTSIKSMTWNKIQGNKWNEI